MTVRRWAAHFSAPAVLALGLATMVCATHAETPHGETAVTCNNTSSGTGWQIKINYDQSTVDSNPARISEREISWRDENRWNYTLDRKSGDLTIVLASSTGGSFFYHHCKLEH